MASSNEPESLARLLGGSKGAIDASLPVIAFVAGWLATGRNVGWGAIAAIAVAFVIVVWRLRAGARPRAVLLGALGACASALVALYTGRAEDFFLIQIFTNAASHKRENLTVRASYDEGRTWPSSRVLYPGPAAYSTVIALQNGEIAVLYERGAVDSIEKITFARFPFGWIATR